MYSVLCEKNPEAEPELDLPNFKNFFTSFDSFRIFLKIYFHLFWLAISHPKRVMFVDFFLLIIIFKFCIIFSRF